MVAEILLGPVLRRADGPRAIVWVQVTEASTVRVTAGPAVGEARAFRVGDLHFALVVVDGLAPGETPYRVEVDGVVAWPPEDYEFPAPVIRRRDADAPVTIAFGSCREARPSRSDGLDPDALDAFAARLVPRDPADRPDLLMLLGDQVYADETSNYTQGWLRRRRRRRVERVPPETPPKEVVTFAEYARLYRESWTDPEVRWLLSTVPTVMIFDDHEIIDDWNTSDSWRRDMAARPWWRERISAGLSSYWVFQHAGNLHPAELADDPVYKQLMALDGADAHALLHEFGAVADAAVDGGDAARPYRWSFALDLGAVRAIVLDNRGARVLTPGKRAMVSAAEWDWFDRAATEAGYRHLVIGSSLPWLLPFGIHDVEAASERWAESRSRPVARFGEWLRRALDLEHWPAFGASFDELAATLAVVGKRELRPPATISVAAGDVHHSYVARATYPSIVVTPVYQLTCSPVHNRVPPAMRPLMRLAWRRRGRRIGRVLARRAGATRPLVAWEKLAGPYFGNAITTLRFDGESARVTVEGIGPDGALFTVADLPLHAGPEA